MVAQYVPFLLVVFPVVSAQTGFAGFYSPSRQPPGESASLKLLGLDCFLLLVGGPGMREVVLGGGGGGALAVTQVIVPLG